ncbi:glycosyltransferase family A protein [Microbulbifer bruguierae]|uniref:Glycosyltransferase family A protein n=1 Tax=Microbulbifer bruguierae TaxID=3029061 RepID=A0ABY8NBU0_9GAMM|nr:glycosyltransferase family A protein [Microbulbifer bruguierae]WGL16396.1 glycosyltransferase family A protein [Microbulbifer bruguierae]
MQEFEQPKNFLEALEVIERLRTEMARQRARLSELEKFWSESSEAESRSIFKDVVKGLGSVFEKKGVPVGHGEVELIRDSGLFDEPFYRSQCSFTAVQFKSPEELIQDYILVGGFVGRDPSADFDSDWYLSANPDVKSAKVNPLLHYVQYGKSEGRLPYHGANVESIAEGKPVSSSALKSRMWGGFYHLAWPELERRVEQKGDSMAAWHMAAWLFAHGDIEEALPRVEESISISGKGASRRTLVGLAKCYSLLGEFGAILPLLEDKNYSLGFGSTLPFVRSNALRANDQLSQRLSALNEIFYRVGLAGARLKDESRDLALDNLSSEAAVPAFVDHTSAGDKPLVSVIMPVYNASATLQIALDGLLEQSLKSLEVIIVDDGSSDNTAQVAIAYTERDPRVRYVANSVNMGAYPTRNEGMKLARGEFVTVHDSDDWSHPQKLERQLQPLLHNPEKVASFSSWVRVLGDMTFVGPWLLDENFVEKNHSSALIRKSALDMVGMWDAVNVAADTEFLWRLEHHYGHDAIVSVLPSTPLSFALSDDTTLTRTKATHVKTIHYGLRRVYRESARWWHRQNDGKPVSGSSAGRDFPIPLAICRGTPREFDVLLVADFSVRGKKLHSLLDAIRSRVECGERVVLFHWPNYVGWHGASIVDEVFSLCHEFDIAFAHVGLRISAPLVVMMDGSLWEYPPTHAVEVDGLEKVEDAAGELFGEQAEIKTYFNNGGVMDA